MVPLSNGTGKIPKDGAVVHCPWPNLEDGAFVYGLLYFQQSLLIKMARLFTWQAISTTFFQ
jgi:hypothetical protein